MSAPTRDWLLSASQSVSEHLLHPTYHGPYIVSQEVKLEFKKNCYTLPNKKWYVNIRKKKLQQQNSEMGKFKQREHVENN